MIINITQWDEEIKARSKKSLDKNKNSIKLRGLKTMPDGTVVCIYCEKNHKMYSECSK